MAKIIVVTGPMGSGKSERIIAEFKKYTIARKKILAIKPARDTRTPGAIASRRLIDGEWVLVDAIEAFDIHSEEQLRDLIRRYNPDVIICDEGQFFDEWFLAVIRYAAKDLDIAVWISALDLDAWREPLLLAGDLCALADEVIKETAVCSQCLCLGARFTRKIAGSSKRIELGSSGLYEASCDKCYAPPPAETS